MVVDVKKKATLTLSNNFKAVGQSTIICHKGVSFGEGCLISWDCLIMDRDYHSIFDKSMQLINNPRPVLIGDYVWIGCRSTIFKGVSISSNTVIAACSLISKSFSNEKAVITGNGNEIKILKENITWSIKEEL